MAFIMDIMGLWAMTKGILINLSPMGTGGPVLRFGFSVYYFCNTQTHIRDVLNESDI
jgi:hypothetical protein